MTVVHKCNKEAEIAVMQADVSYIREKLDHMDKRLFGNGTPGILAEQNSRIVAVEKKLIFYLGAMAVITFIITYGLDRLLS